MHKLLRLTGEEISRSQMTNVTALGKKNPTLVEIGGREARVQPKADVSRQLRFVILKRKAHGNAFADNPISESKRNAEWVLLALVLLRAEMKRESIRFPQRNPKGLMT